MAECDDLRLGGTLSGSGITGGTTINSTRLEVESWSEFYGHPGFAGDIIQVNGRPGGFIAGDMLARPRFLNLNIRATRAGGIEPTPSEQLVANTDLFLGLLQQPETLMELDLPDGSTRFLTVTALDPFSIQQPRTERIMTVPLVGDWPYWREGGSQNTDTVSGADTITNAGTVAVYDAVFVFSGNGTFTHTDWTLEVTGASGAVTVDTGTRTVTQGGNPAPNLLRTSRRDWAWFDVGANTVSSTVSVTVTWRTQYE